MDLDKLQDALDRLEEYHQYIAKAQQQKEKFPMSVVQKVILNYELRMQVEVDKAQPIIDSLEQQCHFFAAQIVEMRAQAAPPEELQEIELMYTIGALSDEEYHRQKREIEQSASLGDEQEVQRQLDYLLEIHNRWTRLSQFSSDLSMDSASPMEIENASQETSFTPKPVSIAQEPAKPVMEVPAPVFVEPPPVIKEAPQPPPPLIKETPPPPPPLPERVPEIMMVEEEDSISEVQAIPEPMSDALVIEDQFMEHETFLVDEEEPDLGGRFLEDSFVEEESDFGAFGEELPLELEEEPAPDLEMLSNYFEPKISHEDAPVSSEIRSALLLKNEGSPHEEVYTFSGEQYGIGRHQDNNIQIKGDTKVSRFHCKLFRRNGHFYIEDQHSSNGTLVNGELISERRLYGGEELKIGETVFRFRLQ